MEKNCYSCKWRYTDKCNCKELQNTFSMDTKRGFEYSEGGYLHLALQENFKTTEVIELIIEKLIEENFIKKSFLSKKLSGNSIDDIELNLYEIIDNALYKSLDNFFDGKVENIEIQNKEFCCKYWE